ncbi:hypothetical protein ACFGVS_16045 [Mucilaginibacter sp. AW1-7]|uniref:hypothetical protein n=1 Tax=Mucilaginibacter sp. AW1-7 TaxID=3349874 RepID=UPI003F73EA7C
MKIKNFAKILFVVLFQQLSGVSYSQTPDLVNYYSRVSPPSPEAARFAQYGNYNVSYYTGRPQIGIPLYTINSSSLQLPITLNYEGTGSVVDDLASWTGSGWLLNAGGLITRVVMGKPDEGSGGFLSQTHYTYDNLMVNSPANASYMFDVSMNRADTEPDIYYYNFNGHSGQFTYDQSNNIYQMPQTGLKITRVGMGFQIVDENGNIYTFAGNENSDSETGSTTAQENCTTSWWLTQIQNPEKTDNIVLKYETDYVETEHSQNYSATYGENCVASEGDQSEFWIYVSGSGVQNYHSETIREWWPVRLTEIDFTNGKILFNRVADRLDGGSSRLDNIVFYNSLNGAFNKLKTIKLITDYFHYTGTVVTGAPYYSSTTGTYRLRLNRLEEYDAQGLLVSKHSFNYNSAVMPTYRGSLAQDFWGYYNGADNNNTAHSLLPVQSTWDSRYQIGAANRNSDENYMKAGVLTSITYPTGGSTNFNWEANKFQYSSTTAVPVTQSVTAFGNNSYNDPHPSQRLTFVQNEQNQLPAVLNVSFTTFNKATAPAYTNPDYQEQAEDSYPGVYLTDVTTGTSIYLTHDTNGGSPYTYSGNVVLNKGDTYELGADCFVNSSSVSASISVTYNTTVNTVDVRPAGGLRIASIETYSSTGVLSSKDTYKYGISENGYGVLSSPADKLYSFSYNRNYEWDSAVLGCIACPILSTAKTIYTSTSTWGLGLASGSPVTYPVVTKYSGDATTNNGKNIFYYTSGGDYSLYTMPPGAEMPIYPVTNKWMNGLLNSEETYKNTGSGYQLKKQVTNSYGIFNYVENNFVKVGLNRDMSNGAQFTYDKFYVRKLPITSGTYKLIQTTIKEFEDSGTIQTDKTYTYDNTYHDFPVDETIVNSNGRILKTTSKYPFDNAQIDALTTPAYLALVKLQQNNVLSPVVEKQEFVNNVLLSRLRVNYNIWTDVSADMVKPASVQTQYKTSAFEDRVFYNKYDVAGNLRSRNLALGSVNGIQWGYNNQYTVAQATDANYNDIFFDSFEEGNGNSTDARTGHYSHTGAYTKALSGLDAGNYTLSYWQKSGSVWSLVSTMVTVTGSTYTIGSSPAINAQIDDVRFCPATAQMTTYTYDPLIGMTSATDAKNQTTYYEYDGYQRLINIKDKDGNIVKHTDYHYQGQ